MSRSSLGRKLPVRLHAALRLVLVAGLFALVACLPFVNAGAWQQDEEATVRPRAASQPAAKGQANIVEGAEFVPGDVLVRFRTETAAMTAEAAALPLRAAGDDGEVTIERFEGSEMVKGLRLAKVDPARTLEAVAELASRPDVLYAEPNYIWRATRTPNDPRYVSGEMYGLNNIGAPAAWNTTVGSRSVVVGVIDSGIDINHPDLKDNIWKNPGETPGNNFDDDGNGLADDVNGWDFHHNDSSVYDSPTEDDHGTHVAGTIGAHGDNNIGVTGVNWEVSIISIKVLGPDGGSTSNIIKGYNYARNLRQAGVNLRVLNNSYGGSGHSLSAHDAISQLNSAGILFVAAAGNSARDNFSHPHYPSSYDLSNVIAVASTTSTDALSGFSNFGARLVSIGAPGSSILSTTPNNTYSFFGGTSMAAPHVAGAAALICSANATCANSSAVNAGITTAQLRGLLAFTGDRIPAIDGKTTTGRRLNVANAMASALENDTTAPATAGNFRITGQSGRSVTLAWNAPGDNGNTGMAADYDFFFITSLQVRTMLPTTLAPAAAGTPQTVTVDMPFINFSGRILLYTYDDAGNASTATVDVTVPVNAGSDPYTIALSASPGLAPVTGTSLVTGDDKYIAGNLPFPFPFYGVNRTNVTVSTNGVLYFSTPPRRDDGDADDVPSSVQGMQGQAMIAGLWDDIDINTTLRPDSGIFVRQPDANHVVIRWQGVTFQSPRVNINFEIELRSDGTIQMRYGDNPRVFPVVGISGGEPDAYIVASHTREQVGPLTSPLNLTNAQTVTFAPRVAEGANVCPQAQPISFGQTINGTLATGDCLNPIEGDGSRVDEYTFTGSAGQQIAVSMSGAFDTYLYLLNPDGTVLAINDDIDPNVTTNSRIPPTGFITLPSSGVYSILANSFRPEDGGAYTVTLTAGTTCNLTPIVFGDTKTGTLNSGDCTNPIDADGTPVDYYTFSGTAGQQVAITMTATSGNLNPYLYLLTPAGDLLADDDNGGGGTAARLPQTAGFGRLPVTGTYTIIANTLQASQSGNYNITLTKATTDCASVPLTAGTPLGGSLANGDCRLLEDGSFIDAYTFTGTSGEQQIITMTSSTPGLVPVLFLLAPTGEMLDIDSNQDGDNTARIPSNGMFFTLPVTGTYTVLANSFAPNQTGHYTVALQKFRHTISGQVTGGGSGLSGVTVNLSGAVSASTTTDASGNYSFVELPAGNNYTITPTNTAQYSFTAQAVNALQSNQTVNFNGTLRTYTVSGQVTTGGTSLGGVTVTLAGAAGFTPRIVTTAADGSYSFTGVPAGGNYTLTAAKTNYTFAPSSIAVANLLADRSGANFVGTLRTFLISGRVTIGTNGLAGVSIALGGSTTGITQTDANGNYSFNVTAGGNYSVTPSRANYTFAPTSHSFINVSDNQTGNFSGTLNTYTISGQVVAGSSNLGGVTVTLGGSQSGTTTTDANGNYAFANLPAGANYTVTATKLNYTFAPPSRTFTNLSGNQTASNFTATLNTYILSGRVTGANGGLGGVTVSLSDAQAATTTTDADGNYSFSVLAGSNYTVTPTHINYTFAPASQVFNNLSSNQAGNFTGTLNTYTISGQVVAGSVGLGSVTMTLGGSQSGTATTDAGGNYSFSVTAGGTYTVTPSKAFYSFEAPVRTFAGITTNQTANFTATLLTYTLSGRVSQGASGLPGVTLVLSGGRDDTTTTDAQGNYSFSNLTGGSSVVVTPGRAHYTFAPASQSINIDGERAGINFEATPVPNTIGFTSNAYQAGEGGGRATLNVTRTGDTSGAATVDYRIIDTDTFTVGCFDPVNNQGGAFARCDFATTVGTLAFAPGETSKQITVPLIDDGHVEESETFQLRLANPSGAILGTPETATVTITDNDAAGAQNPILTHPFFVRQQYLDFLSREPDTSGFNAWLSLLNDCENAFNGPANPSGCDRIFVSGEGFFRSLEFQLKGFYVFRFYKAGFDRLPEYLEIVSDMSYVAGQTAEEVYARKAQLATNFTGRAEFQTAYGGMTNAQYVAALLGRYGLTQVTTPDPAQPDGSAKVTLTSAELTNKLDTNALTRAQVLRAIADSDAVGAAEFDNAFVGMQYYGYLRRKPDPSGFNAWLGVLQSGNVRTMVDGFLNSTEYKLRFGQP